MTQSHTHPAHSHTAEPPRHGHHWREPERVQQYVARMDERAAERARQFALLTWFVPFEQDATIRVLDIGAGHGVVAAAVLDAFPNAQATLLDVSEAMIAVGEERMQPYAGRFRYVQGDFAGGVLPADLAEPFDAVVSSLAIHHLPGEGKRTLYADIAQRLAPGGCFLNLDTVAAPDEETEALYQQASARERAARGEPPPSGGHHRSELQTLDEHLGWLRAAGLTRVDIFWKQLDMALIGGYRPAAPAARPAV